MTYFKLTESNKVQKFITLIKTIKLFNDYISFIFDSDKLYIQGMDGSHICLYEININKEWFDEYNYTNDKSQIIMSCVSSIMNKILSLAKTNQGINIGFDDNNCEKINIDIYDILLKDSSDSQENKNINEKNFEINCVDIDFDLLTPDEMDYDVDLYINSKELSNYFSELIQFGEDIYINCESNLLKLSSLSGDNSMVQKLSFDQIERYEVIENYNIKTKYQLNYLNNISTLHKVFPIVKLCIQNNVPLCAYFEDIDNDDNVLLYIRFYLAPKMDDDEF